MLTSTFDLVRTYVPNLCTTAVHCSWFFWFLNTNIPSLIIQLLDCPEQCHCRKGFNGLTISCVDSQLKQVIPVIPKDTTELLLSDNLIANISSADFAECFNITKLDLSLNALAFLRMNYFNDLVNLKYLNLAHNDWIRIQVSHRVCSLASLNYEQLYWTIITSIMSIRSWYSRLLWRSFPILLKNYSSIFLVRNILLTFSRNSRISSDLDFSEMSQCQSVLSNSSFSLLRKLPLQKLKIQFDRLNKSGTINLFLVTTFDFFGFERNTRDECQRFPPSMDRIEKYETFNSFFVIIPAKICWFWSCYSWFEFFQSNELEVFTGTEFRQHKYT